jgi:hypothetical protein
MAKRHDFRFALHRNSSVSRASSKISARFIFRFSRHPNGFPLFAEKQKDRQSTVKSPLPIVSISQRDRAGEINLAIQSLQKITLTPCEPIFHPVPYLSPVPGTGRNPKPPLFSAS